MALSSQELEPPPNPGRFKEVVPFWSSRSRLEKVATEHPKYATYQPEQLPLEEFLQKTLALFEEENIQVGVNWSGARLSGYDISPQDMKKNIAHWLSGNVASQETPPK